MTKRHDSRFVAYLFTAAAGLDFTASLRFHRGNFNRLVCDRPLHSDCASGNEAYPGRPKSNPVIPPVPASACFTSESILFTSLPARGHRHGGQRKLSGRWLTEISLRSHNLLHQQYHYTAICVHVGARAIVIRGERHQLQRWALSCNNSQL